MISRLSKDIFIKKMSNYGILNAHKLNFLKKYEKTIDNVKKIVYTYTCLNDKYAPLAQLVRATGS